MVSSRRFGLKGWISVIAVVLALADFASALGPMLNEFLAVNESGVEDEDGDASDWIEIHNPDPVALDLGGWYLTDDADNLTKWEFPSTPLGAGAFRVIFASNKDRAVAGEELHTNFKLGGGGEYLALVMPDGVSVATAFSPAFPRQFPDVSYGFGAVSGDVMWIQAGDPCRYLVPPDGSLGTSWTDRVGFDDSSWGSGTTGIGYATDNDTLYLQHVGTDVESVLYDVSGSIYVRIPFVVDDPSGFTGLRLRMKYDDGFAAYLNGTQIASRFVPSSLNWTSTATATHPDSQAVVYETILIPDGDDSLTLGTNVLALHGLNASTTSSDLLFVPELEGTGRGRAPTPDLRYFQTPTPGSVNGVGTADQGPVISDVTHTPAIPAGDEDLVVTATIGDGAGAATSVGLRYRVRYGPEIRMTLFDDGTHDDGAAGDGRFGARIPASAYGPGDMVRYAVTAADDQAHTSRWPLEEDLAEYLGTVVEDPALTNPLPIFHWFVEDPDWYHPFGYNNRNWSAACVFYLGRFYDNVQVRVRGQTASTWPNPPFKFEFNKGHWFYCAPDLALQEEININTFHSDKAFMRLTLAAETYRDAGVPASDAFPLRVQQNGEFFSVAAFVEQVDERFLSRQGLDPDGALYKMFNPGESAYTDVRKITRKNEPNDDLAALLDAMQSGSQARRTAYLFDHVDIPAYVNALVATSLMHDNDGFNKNHYLYRDTEGNGEWTMIPWDKDLSFGRNWSQFPGPNETGVLNDDITYTAAPVGPVSIGHKVSGALYGSPRIMEMFARRYRSVMDQVLQPPATPDPQKRYETRIQALHTQMENDVALHRAAWGNPFGISQTFAEGIHILTRDFLQPRRNHLYVTHHQGNGGIIPDAQIDRPTIRFGAVLFAPPTANQDQEYIELVNPNRVAVDLSGWSLTDAVSLTLKPGVVLGAGETLYLSPDVVEFRARATSPRGGENRFVQGDYQGHLSAWGETLELRDAFGVLIDSLAYVGAPSLQQQGLRITEIMYDPADPPPESPYEDGHFEYIELQNISTHTLDLTGVRFTDGIQYVFTNGVTSLAPGEFAVVVRNLDAFASRYGTQGLAIAGTFTGKFANRDEKLKLEDPLNETILSFTYSDQWYPETDGGGYSLTIVDATADHTAWGQPELWRPSARVHGSPGWDDSGLVDGDGDQQPDPWEIRHFSATDAAGGGPTDDFDGDGMLNRAEYIAGTDPSDSNSMFTLRANLSGSVPVLSFEARAATGPSYTGLQRFYALEAVDHSQGMILDTWTGIPGYTNLLGQHHTVTYPDASDEGARYFRARTWME